jgi:hypothetical protein
MEDVEEQVMRLARAAALRDRGLGRTPGEMLNRAERRAVEQDARRRAKRAMRVARQHIAAGASE